MSKGKSPSFDDLSTVNQSNDDDDGDVETIKLEPGEDFVAEVRHIEKDVGRYGNNVIHLTKPGGGLAKYWSNRTVDQALDAADVGPGDTIGVRKADDSYTFTAENDDGEEEEREAFDFDVGVLDHGGDD